MSLSRVFFNFFQANNRVSPGFRLFFACSHEQAKPLNSRFFETCRATFAFELTSRTYGKILPLLRSFGVYLNRRVF